MDVFERILVATDFGEASEGALDLAAKLAEQSGANLIVVHCWELPVHPYLQELEDTHPDLIVIGTHGRRGLKHVVLGSMAEKIVRYSPIPVLTVHAAGPSPALPPR